MKPIIYDKGKYRTPSEGDIVDGTNLIAPEAGNRLRLSASKGLFVSSLSVFKEIGLKSFGANRSLSERFTFDNQVVVGRVALVQVTVKPTKNATEGQLAYVSTAFPRGGSVYTNAYSVLPFIVGTKVPISSNNMMGVLNENWLDVSIDSNAVGIPDGIMRIVVVVI